MTVKGDRERSFMEWFHEATLTAGIYDYRYTVKGCGVWPPYGFKLRQNVLNILRRLLDEAGHEECLFPLLIPKSLLDKEKVHIKGFESEVFWVTHGGTTELDEKLALRPTSETVVMQMFKFWIHDYTDLPKKVYQIVNTFRYETKATHPMIRVREVTSFKEAHTAHATYEEAEKQVEEGIRIYKAFFDELGIPYVISRRPEWDKFAGALYSVSFETITPDGRTLQIGTVHHLGQNFSKAFDVTYLKPDGSHEYVYTTSYGVSERVIAALISLHGDERGVVLPPNVAPIQVVVVPIPYKGKEKEVELYSREVLETLKGSGYRVTIDDRQDVTPGGKFYYWERKGVPLRAEVGPIDVEKKMVTLARRDTFERSTCSLDKLANYVGELLSEVMKNLKERAWKRFKERIRRINTLNEALKTLKEGLGIVVVPWCGSLECALKVDSAGLKVLGSPLKGGGEDDVGNCVICNKEAKSSLRLAYRTF